VPAGRHGLKGTTKRPSFVDCGASGKTDSLQLPRGRRELKTVFFFGRGFFVGLPRDNCGGASGAAAPRAPRSQHARLDRAVGFIVNDGNRPLHRVPVRSSRPEGGPHHMHARLRLARNIQGSASAVEAVACHRVPDATGLWCPRFCETLEL